MNKIIFISTSIAGRRSQVAERGETHSIVFHFRQGGGPFLNRRIVVLLRRTRLNLHQLVDVSYVDPFFPERFKRERERK